MRRVEQLFRPLEPKEGLPQEVPDFPASSPEFVRAIESRQGQISFEPIRRRQSPEATLAISCKALNLIEQITPRINECDGPNIFMGCVDFMIGKEHQLAICEANGASSRGIHALSLEKYPSEASPLFAGRSSPELLVDGVAHALNWVKSKTPTILIGIKPEDSLVVDALAKARRVWKKGREMGKPVRVFIADYHYLFPPAGEANIWLEKNSVFYRERDGNQHKINCVLGDGVWRRMSKGIQQAYHQGKLDVLVVNQAHQATDNKAATYRIVEEIKNRLETFSVAVLESREVGENEYLEATQRFMEHLNRPVVIKPYGGSGAKGSRVIHDPTEVEEAFAQSIQEFQYAKNMSRQTGFPYTVQEFFPTLQVSHRGQPGYYCDLRVYVARATKDEREILIPVGYLNRVSPIWATNLSKKEDEGGGVDMDRGYGTRYTEIFGGDDVYIRAGAVACILLAEINNRYQRGLR